MAPFSATTALVLACAAAAFALGLLDDFRHLAPSTKLVGQVLIASLLFWSGVRVEIVTEPALQFIITVFWVVGLMNAVNLMDNMDGLAAGIATISGIALAITAADQSPMAGFFAASTAGAALGFLVHNFHPARIFMGDAGSLALGFLLAVAALLHTATGAANVGLAVLGPLAVLALPIFDTALVTASRRWAGRPIGRGGRDHTSHRLSALGLSDRSAVLFLYGVAIVLAVVGLVGEALSGLVVPLFALAVIALVLFGAFLSEVDVYGAEKASRPEQGFARELFTSGRFGLEVALDVTLLTVAYYLSWVIRFEGFPQSTWLALFGGTVHVVVGAQLAALLLSRVYRTLWRYLDVTDVVRMIRALAIGSAVAAAVILLGLRPDGYSRGVVVLDALLAAALVVSSRSFVLWLRRWFRLRPHPDERRVLIIGASEVGALAMRLLERGGGPRYRTVGFLDDDPGKRYRRVGGVPVVGRVDDLEAVVSRLRPDLVLFAMHLPSPEPSRVDRLRRLCHSLGLEWREFAMPVARWDAGPSSG